MGDMVKGRAAVAKAAQELGDLAIVWMTLCSRHDLAPETVLTERWATVQNRQWVSNRPAVGAPTREEET